jgi:hypothetical protein
MSKGKQQSTDAPAVATRKERNRVAARKIRDKVKGKLDQLESVKTWLRQKLGPNCSNLDSKEGLKQGLQSIDSLILPAQGGSSFGLEQSGSPASSDSESFSEAEAASALSCNDQPADELFYAEMSFDVSSSPSSFCSSEDSYAIPDFVSSPESSPSPGPDNADQYFGGFSGMFFAPAADNVWLAGSPLSDAADSAHEQLDPYKS